MTLRGFLKTIKFDGPVKSLKILLYRHTGESRHPFFYLHDIIALQQSV